MVALFSRRGTAEVAGSPFELDVLPGATSASNSVVYGLDLSAIAGVPAKITVQVQGSLQCCKAWHIGKSSAVPHKAG